MIYRLGEWTPECHDDTWVADNATVVGRVKLAAGVVFGSTRFCGATEMKYPSVKIATSKMDQCCMLILDRRS